MKKNPVSAIIIARDEEDEIEGCLESVVAAEPDEIIVVIDDRTVDLTFEKAKRLTENVYLAKGYRSGLRNYGWRKARNDLICFIEADMRIPPNYFTELLTEINQSAKIAAVGTGLLPLGPALCGKLEWMLWDNAKIFGTAGVVYKKKSLVSVDGFNETLESGEDADLSSRLEKKGWQRRLLENPKAYHRFPQKWKVLFHKYKYGSARFNLKTLLLFLVAPLRAPLIAIKYKCWHLLWFYPLRWFYLLLFSGQKGYKPIK